MKKSLLALAVLSVVAGTASAQSSVTLSGSVDLGVVRQNGAWNMSNAGSSRSNLSFSGTEDLGGGMNAFFYLNHRFNVNTGAQRDANAFYRQAWVGLGGGFGNLRLGKMLPPLQVFNGDFDPFGTDTVGSVHTGGIFSGQTTSGSRYNNAIYYTTPVLGGLTGHAMIAAADNNGEIVAANGTERPIGLGLNYAAGPLRLSAAYDRNADDKKTVGLYGSFNVGAATLMAQFEKGDVYTNAFNSEDSVKRWSVGAKVPFGAAALKVGYTKWSDEDVKKFGIGLDYSLSKRTTLYTDAGKLSGDGRVIFPSSQFTSSSPTPGLLTDNNRKTRFDVGINHKF